VHGKCRFLKISVRRIGRARATDWKRSDCRDADKLRAFVHSAVRRRGREDVLSMNFCGLYGEWDTTRFRKIFFVDNAAKTDAPLYELLRTVELI
jgi:hypothetical protein